MNHTITLLIACVWLTTLEGSEVRSVKFREVLHAVARKAGYSPESGNFLTNQAIPVGEYISAWVDRLYSAEDWPEWTKVVRIAPGADHIVPYQILPGGPASTVIPINMWRVINVYLVDPETTSVPISTRFTLQEEGVHCGYEHGTFVWIKFIEPSPEFTAEVWRAENTYQRDDVVYSADTGECYKSKTNNNIGNDPTPETTEDRNLTTEITQEATLGSAGVSEQNQVLRLYFQQVSPGPNPADPPVNLSLFAVAVFDADGVSLSSQSDGGTGSRTIAEIMDFLRTAMLVDLGAGWTITNNASGKYMDIENASKFTLTQAGTLVPSYLDPSEGYDVTHFLKIEQRQPYIPAAAGIAGLDQIIELTFTSPDIIPDAIYTVTFREADGQEHIATYTALDTDGINEVMAGILAAITTEAATDDFFYTVFGSISDATTMAFTTHHPVSLDATVTRDDSPYWAIVPFPEALFNAVVRGAGADLLTEWGQNQTGSMEEAKVGSEQQSVSADFQTTPTAPLTTQQKPYSRYRY